MVAKPYDSRGLTVEQLFQGFLDAVPDGISIMDRDLSILRINRVLKQLQCFSTPLTGKKCYEVCSLLNQPVKDCPALESIKIGEMVSKEVPLTREKRQVGWLELRAYPIKDEEGAVTGVVELVRDITKEKEQEKAARESGLRAVRQRTALVRLLTETTLESDNLLQKAKALTEISSRTVQAERTSIWLLSDDEAQLKCLDLYELSKNSHSRGMVLKTADYHDYINAIKNNGRVYVHNANDDSRTIQLAATYLDPLDVRSMLDAGIFIEGKLIGLFSFESVGEYRRWHVDDELFASTVAVITAQAIEASNRFEAERIRDESENKYRSIFHGSADPLFIMQKTFVDCNEEACRYWGYSRDELIGCSPVDFSPPVQPDGRKTSEAAELYLNEAIKGNPQTFYWQHQHRNGYRLDSEVKLSGIEIGGEKYLIAAVRDISMQKKAEEIIWQNRDWYRALAEDIPILVARISPAGKVTYINETFRTIIGQSFEQIDGRIFYDLIPKEYRAEVEKSFKSLTPDNPIVTFEHNNKGRLYRWKNRAVFNPDNTIKEYFAVGEDITEDLLAEQRLRESESRNRAMIEAMPDKLFRYSRDGYYIDAQVKEESQLTKKARQLHREKRLIGSNITDVFAPELASLLMNGIEAALKTGEVQLLEYSYETEAAAGFFEARLIATGKDEVISIVRDINERHNAEEAIKYQLRYETLLAEISSLFVNTPSEDIDQAINRTLQLSGEFFEADRSYLMRFTPDRQYIINPYEWCAEGVFSVQERNREMPVSNTPWWAEQILSRDYVYVPDVDQLPPEATVDKADFKIEAIRSMITIPMIKYGEVFAFFGFDAVKAKKSWSEQQISMIKVVAEIISESLAKAEAQEALKESEERYRDILVTMEEGYYETDLEGNFTFCNEAAGRLLGGYSQDEFLKLSYFKLYKNPELAFATFNRVYKTGLPEKELVLEMIKKDGSLAFGEISIALRKDINGKVLGFKGIGKDVTSRIEYERQLEYLSLHDQLTGIYNRAYYESELKRLEGSREYPISIISADLDGLKLINDTLGHDKGDQLLCNCAMLIKEALRSYDLLARIGGDEFSAILQRTDRATGENIVKRIREIINQYNQDEVEIPVGISIGIATAEDTDIHLREVFKQADDGMYRDKLSRSSSSRSKIVQGLLAALAERDYLTEGHAVRLQELCRAVGEEAGLSSHKLADLALLAQVHDLGKVGIPDRILYKPGPLTDDEWEIMRGHSEKGYRIASASPDLVGVATLILKHHEHWNGSGYPLGLEGEEIPVECRILSIVDAFDAMTNKRPYNHVKTTDEAIEEIKRCSGSQFDPYLVEVFLKVAGRD